MIIYKNKASGKYFIHIEDLEDNKALFVLPDDKDGKVLIKDIKLDLFHDEPEEDDDEVLLKRQLVSKKQLEKYSNAKRQS
ncbi:MAG: hypothetical protein KAS40_03805 [Desulfobacterales bacterium]|jgi:hypothetical protein|nr:hypothetical protein [Desulfobacterales bacterium]